MAVTDAEGRTTRYDYAAYAGPGDARLVAVTDAAGTTTRYRYHVSGALERVEGPSSGVVRTWTYDANARLVEEVQPESGRTRYSYDPAGNLTTITNANNQVIGFSYDANNRLVRRTAPETVFVYDTAGRVREQRTDAVTTRFTFDSSGRPTRRSDTGTGFAFSSTYSYDAYDALTQITYPSGRTVAYDYDTAGRLSRVLMNGQVFATAFTYADNGQLARYTTGAVTHAVTYDTRDRVATLRAGPSSASALDLTYAYDKTSNVTRITDHPRPGMTQTFEYDALQRLARATGYGGWTIFSYDAEGNRTAASYAHGVSTAYVYDPATRRLRSTSGTVPETFTYDAAGRLTQDARGTYSYSPVGHLLRAQAPNVDATYQYDADEQRLRRVVNGVTHWTLRSLGGEVLSEYQTRCGTRAWVRDTVYAGGRPLGAVRATRDTPTVSFLWTSSTVGEETGGATVPVRATTANGAPLPCPVAVHYEMRPGGSAAPGRDFALQAGTLTFAAGTASATTQTLSIPLTNDASDEDNLGFVLFLTGATGAELGPYARHAVVIADDDPPPVLTVPDVTVTESASQAVFTLTLSAPSAKEVQVTYATVAETAQAGADYTAVNGALRLAPGTRSATIRVPLREDASAEGDETFRLTLSAPVNVTLARTAARATIRDNERPRAPIDLSLPGRFFADMTAASTEADYLHIANPYANVSIPVRLTFTRPDGSGVRREFTLGPRQRRSLLLANEPGLQGDTEVSVAVQSRDTRYTVLAEHSHYWGSGWEGGRATEGVQPRGRWYLAEGSTHGYDEWITIFNPASHPVWVNLDFYLPSGYWGQRRVTIAEGPGRTRVHINDILGPTAHATFLTAFVAGSTTLTPIVVERTMTWQNRLDGHSSPGVNQPASQWGFAEGTTGALTYLALFNPGDGAISVRIDYLHENGTPYTVDVPVPGKRRVTVAAPSWLPTGAFALSVYTLNGARFVAERMLYAPDQRYGHAGPGQISGTSWHLVEGTTSSFFDTFLALGNWNAQAVTVTIHYINGGQILKTQTVTVPALSRRTVLVDAAAGIGQTEFQTQVIGSLPILVDRITYWPGVATATGSARAPATTMVVAPDEESPPRLGADPGGGGDAKAPSYGTVVTGTPVNDAAIQAAAAGPAPRPAATAASGWYGSHLTTGGVR